MYSINYKISLLLIITILIHFYLPFPFVGFKFNKKRNYINRLYLSIFTSFVIVLTDVILNKDELTNEMFYIWLMLLIAGISIFYYIISNQLFVNEEEYLLTMKENHEIDLHIAKAIIEHQHLDNKGKEYTEKIKKNRAEELNFLNELIK